MLRRLQFTFLEGAIFISYVDQKISALQAKMDGLKISNNLKTQKSGGDYLMLENNYHYWVYSRINTIILQ